MSLPAHLAELSEKHRLLERKIEEELARPASDHVRVQRLKMEKLKLKDEMERTGGEPDVVGREAQGRIASFEAQVASLLAERDAGPHEQE